MSIAVFALARPTFDVELAAEQAQAAYRSLANSEPVAGSPQLLTDAAQIEDAVAQTGSAQRALFLQASFSDASMICALAASYPGELGIWAFPEERTGGRLRINSFCGLHLAAHALRRRGRSCSYLYADPSNGAGKPAMRNPPQPQLRDAAQQPQSAHRAARAALDAAAASGGIGLIGERPAGFDTCIYDAELAAERFGLPVRTIALDEFLKDAAGIEPARIRQLRAQAERELAGIDTLDADEVDRALGVRAALADFASDHRLAGVAVRCWPEFFTERGCAACAGMAALGEERIPASCEADVMGTITSALLGSLAGGPAMLADVVDACAQTDTAVLWHCGLAPLSYCAPDDAPAAAVHSNRRMALLHEFALKPGPITMARITAAYGEPALAVGRAEMLPAPRSFSGTSGVCRPACGAQRFADLLIGAGIEHHLSFAYGDVKAECEALAGELRMPVLDLDGAADQAAQ